MELEKLTDRDFLLLRERLMEFSGISLKDDKREVLEEVLNERFRITGTNSLREYLSLILNGKEREELILLAAAITNKETYFFREMTHLERSVELMRELLEKMDKLRILCLGCSSGEEVYTLSILIHERGLLFPSKDIRIIGIDIDPKAIKKAREGKYTANSIRSKDIPLERYFTRDGKFFRIKESYKNIVDFRQGNIIESKTFNDFLDIAMVFCRNVFIYMTEAALLEAINNIYRILSEDGYLIIGSAESITNRTNLFEPVYYEGVVVYRKR